MMAGVLGISLLGVTGSLADPYAARGALIGVFVAMQYMRWRCGLLRTKHVAWTAFAGGFVGVFLGRNLVGQLASGGLVTNIGNTAAAIAGVTLLMAASFHFLTLRRGYMP